MLTSVGRFLRQLRLDHGEILRTMATNLGVSSAFLSAVENGKKKMPESWYQKLQELYELSEGQMDDLRQSVLESGNIVELNIQDTSIEARQLAISFARCFESMDDETRKKIFDILNKTEEE